MPLVDLIKGMDFGVGTDLGGQLFGDAVLRSDGQIIPNTGGKTEDIFLTLVESQEEQDSALQLSTSVSASYGLFGGSGKFDLSQEMHVHNYAISLVIRATVLNSFSQMRDVKFGPEATTQLTNGNGDRFREQFGDMFVRGIQTGGELVAILQIEGHDESDQTSVRADLEASGIIGAVALSTSDSFSSHVSKATSGRKVKLRHFQVGGSSAASILPEKMVEHALNFADEVKAGQSEAFQALLIPYNTIDTPLPPNFVDLENAKESLAILMQMRRDALTRLTAFNFVVANPEQFNIPATMSLIGIVGRFETAVATLTSAASRCVNRPKEATDALKGVAGLDIPVDELPPRRPALTKQGPPPPLTVLVPNFIGADPASISDAQRAAQGGMQFNNPNDSQGNQDQDFLSFFFGHSINMIWQPSNVDVQDLRACTGQQPGPGQLMAIGGDITMQFGPIQPQS